MSEKKTTKKEQDAKEVEQLKERLAELTNAYDVQVELRLAAEGENIALHKYVDNVRGQLASIRGGVARKIQNENNWLQYLGLVADGLREIG